MVGSLPHTNSLTINALTVSDAGSYTVEISNGDGKLTSSAAEIQVRTIGSFSHWQSSHGITAPQEDPNQDGTSNLIEYALGTDPNTADPPNAPVMHLERVVGQIRLIADFDLSIDAVDSIVQVEGSNDLASLQWTPIENGTGGTILTRNEAHLTVSLPADQGRQFLRLTVSLKP